MSTLKVMEPSACTWCGIAQRGHGRQYADAAGWHAWEPPSQEQMLARMKARRLQQAVARMGALPVPVGSEPKCQCAEPDADPYECEAEDCTHEFPELNPFGGGPVQGHDAKVSKVCGCGWRTSVWHVDDGSAEEELHRHVVRVHGGVYPRSEAGDVR